MADDAQAGSEALPGGVSLPSFVAVEVALAEGFPLREVLATEQIERPAWDEAEAEWKQRITAGDAQKSGLFGRYTAARAAAEDWLFRRVAPLDTDPAAWAAFRCALADPKTASGALKLTKLRLNDVSRLTRLWDRKVEIDPSLAGRLRDLEKNGVGRLPEVTPAPPVMRRSKAAEGATAGEVRKAAPGGAVSAPSGTRSGETGTAARAETNIDVGGEAGSPAPGAPAIAQASFMANPPASAARPSFMAGAKVPSFMAAGAPAIAPAPAPARADETADVSALLSGGDLPFSDKAPAAAQAGETVDVGALLSGGELPFSDKASGSGETENAAAAVAKPASLAKLDAGGTVDVSALLETEALPFAGKEHAATGTMDVTALLAGEALPFAEKVEAAPPKVASPAPAVSKPEADGTMDVSALLASEALPFAASPKTAPAAVTVELTVEQYASLCVEIHLRPESVDEVLRRYGVSKEARAALEAGWKQRLQDPRAYDAFARTYAAYKAHLTAAAPAPAAAPQSLPQLSMEQWASLSVDLSVDPARRADTLARYRLSDVQLAQLNMMWTSRLTADPAARAAFDSACAAYRAWRAGGQSPNR